MIYNLQYNGELTDKLHFFETPPDISHKNMFWLEWIDERNPVYDPQLEKLSSIVKVVNIIPQIA